MNQCLRALRPPAISLVAARMSFGFPHGEDVSASGLEDDWKERYTELRKDYDSLEAKIVSLRPREYPITDDKIIKAYRTIRRNTDMWIDELQDTERRGFKAKLQGMHSSQRDSLSEVVRFRDGCLDDRWLKSLGKEETAIYVILESIISSWLRIMLDRPYPLGILPTYMPIFYQMELAMHGMPRVMSNPS